MSANVSRSVGVTLYVKLTFVSTKLTNMKIIVTLPTAHVFSQALALMVA